MTWIKTVRPFPPSEESAPVMEALQSQASLYPPEYMGGADLRVHELVKNDSIVLSHSLIPKALLHAFSTYGVLLSPDLPLSRRQHEMIAATVSACNRCFY